MLFEYLKQTQRFLRDGNQSLLNPEDLKVYVNRARREVAMRSRCIRVTPPISGSIATYSVTNPGSGYTNPTVTISPPDFPSGQLPFPNGDQATAVATLIGSGIASIQSTYGGYGYFQPIVSISDPTGSGATAVPIVPGLNLLAPNQERYDFKNFPISTFPGVGSIYGALSASVVYSNYRYSLPKYSWSVYQSSIRQYATNTYTYVPTFFTQYGQGANGSLFCYPLPSQYYQWEVDCFALPMDLNSDQDVEAIPEPWNDAIAYFAAALSYSEVQNANAATWYYGLFDQFMARYNRAGGAQGRATNPYGRYLIPLTIGLSTMIAMAHSLAGIFA